MRGVRPRFAFWILSLLLLFFLANIQLRVFPHILIIFWCLLPILSLLVSSISKSKLRLTTQAEPKLLPYGSQGHWLLFLENHSSLMAFFLRFPEIQTSRKGKKKAVEIMLQPKEERTVDLPFYLPHTGPYSLAANKPIFEDMLGFFWLDFAHRFTHIQAEVFCLPEEWELQLGKGKESRLGEYFIQADRKSLTNASDEIYSIDAKRPGESLAHAHWKLSARLQSWMIKRYSDHEQQPFRLIIDPKPLAFPVEAVFEKSPKSSLSPQEEGELQKRDRFFALSLAVGKLALSYQQSLELGDRTSRIQRFRGMETLADLSFCLARFPFEGFQESWKLDRIGENRQVVLVQQLTDSILGSLLSYAENGVPFLLASLKGENDPSMVEKTDQSIIEHLWLDEEIEGLDQWPMP